MQGPPEPALREQWRLERRQAARRLHPDRGGDVETYLAALARIDASYTTAAQQRPDDEVGTSPGQRGGGQVVVTRTVRSRIRGRARATRRVARRLVRRVSPSRRYTEI